MTKKDRALFHAIPHDTKGLFYTLSRELGLPIAGLCGTRLRWPAAMRTVTTRDCAKCRQELDRIYNEVNGDLERLPDMWWG